MPSNKSDSTQPSPSSKPRQTKRSVPFGSRNFLGYHRQKVLPEDKVERKNKLRLSPGRKEKDKGNISALSEESKRYGADQIFRWILTNLFYTDVYEL